MMVPPHTASRSDAALSLALHRAARRVEAASAPLVHALGLEYEAYLVLAQLWSTDGSRAQDLADALGMDPDATHRHVSDLVTRGYAEHEAGGTRVWLTDDGHRARAASSHALDYCTALDDRYLADTRLRLDQLATTLTL